jgi:hypothetical protein
MKLASITLSLLVTTAACGESNPGSHPSNDSGEIRARAPGVPSLEIFEGLAAHKDASPEQSAEDEQDVLRWIEKLREADAKRPEASKPGSSLGRIRACNLLPSAMFLLGQRWNADGWNARDRELASGIALLAEKMTPGVAFDFGSDTRPESELRRLMDWFAEQVNDRRTLGQMVAWRGLSPWFPKDAESLSSFVVQASKPIHDDLVLELGHGPADSWCLRVLRGDEVRFTSDLGTPVAQSVTFRDEAFVDLSSYGVRVPMEFRRDAELYVSRPGRPLFYFTDN